MLVTRLQHKIIDVIEYTLTFISNYESEQHDKNNQETSTPEEPSEMVQATPLQRVRHLSNGVYRLTLRKTSASLDIVKATRIYKYTDSYVDFNAKCDLLFKVLVLPAYENIMVVKNTSTQCISLVVQHTSQQKQRLKEFVSKKLPFANISFSEHWLRLDFDQDGSVSLRDIGTSVAILAWAIRNYDYLRRYLQFRNRVYRKAIECLEYEIEQDGEVEEEFPIEEKNKGHGDKRAIQNQKEDLFPGEVIENRIENNPHD